MFVENNTTFDFEGSYKSNLADLDELYDSILSVEAKSSQYFEFNSFEFHTIDLSNFFIKKPGLDLESSCTIQGNKQLYSLSPFKLYNLQVNEDINGRCIVSLYD